MVVFICNACGNSVKKNKVEKHYQTECPGCSVLSCIDCGKDFVGDAYQQHTSCISEAEKYQGKLFKDSDRGKPSKGEQKQQDWTQRIKEIATARRASGDPKIAQLLETIATYQNVPRKKAKFENFVSNSLNVHKPNILGQLWEAFEDAAKKQTSGDCERSGTEEEAVSGSETVTSPVQEEEGGEEKRKKKKRRHKAEEGGDESTECSEGADTFTSPPSAKKKKKSKVKEPEPLSLDPTVGAVVDDRSGCTMGTDASAPLPGTDSGGLPSPKKKKKKKAKRTVDSESGTIGTAPVASSEGNDKGEERGEGEEGGVREEGVEGEAISTVIEHECSTKSKKKGRKPVIAEVPEGAVGAGEIPSTAVNGQNSSTKAEKKKRKGKTVEGEVDNTMGESGTVGREGVDMEVDDQSDSKAVVMATEGLKQLQADKSKSTGETPDRVHKKKKKHTSKESKELMIELVDMAKLSSVSVGAGKLEMVGLEQEGEVDGGSTTKRKSKKHHKKESDVASSCYDDVETSTESKAKRKMK